MDNKTLEQGLDELLDEPARLHIPKTFKNDNEGELEELHECMSDDDESVFVWMEAKQENPQEEPVEIYEPEEDKQEETKTFLSPFSK